MKGAQFDGFDVLVTGSPVFLKDINDYLQGGMVTLGLIALGVMAVVLFLLFRVRWRFLPLLSTVVGVLWGFSALGWIGVDLSLVTISGLPILIGLGIDFAIQMHNRIEEESALDKDAHPIGEAMANIAPALITAVIAARHGLPRARGVPGPHDPGLRRDAGHRHRRLGGVRHPDPRRRSSVCASTGRPRPSFPNHGSRRSSSGWGAWRRRRPSRW